MQDSTNMIHHFTHPHPLTLSKYASHIYKLPFIQCNLCHRKFDKSDRIYGRIYGCEHLLCAYYVHESCALSEERIIHPFHPQHILILKAKPLHVFRCMVCGDNSSQNAYCYYCEEEECGYELDLRCAALMSIELHENPIEHQHSLVLYDKQKGDDHHYACHFCGEVFEEYDRVYICQECQWSFHESCVAPPNEVRHPFHLEHPLTLVPASLDRSRCSVCGRRYPRGCFLYHCSLCSFSMDVHCLTLKPTAENSDTNQQHLPIDDPHPHPHPWIQCDPIENFRRHCFACNLPFKDLIYVCYKCGILHKSCAELLPEMVHSALHPEHPLFLEKGWKCICHGCKKDCGDLVYKCQECRISFDLKCAQAKLHLIKIPQVHQHALAYFDFKTGQMKCNICREICNKFLFRCVECDYNIHDHCYPLLPRTLKHECHCDPLLLNRSKIKELPDADVDEETEFYCYACEEPRILSHPTYYCADCHFIAHVHCVISEVLPYLEKEIQPSLEKELIAWPPELPSRKNQRRLFVQARRKSGPANEADNATPEAGKPKVDPVIHELNAKIAALKFEMDKIAKEIAILEQKRAKRVAYLEYLPDEDA